jgi:hypothetical protein
MKKRWYILGALLFALVVGYHLACAWAKKELERRAHEILGVSVTIDDIGVSFLSASLFLEKAQVQQLPFLGGSLSLEEASVLPDYQALWKGQLRVAELKVLRPSLTSQFTIPALPPLDDLKRLKDLLKKQGKKERQILLPQPLQAIVVEDGIINLSLVVGKSTPKTLLLSHLHYQNHDLSAISSIDLLTDAVYSFDFNNGHISKSSGRFVATNIDLTFLTQLLSPSDSLRFSAGTLDLTWQDGSATIDLKKAKLSKSLSFFSINKEFDLSFTIPIGQNAEERADIRVVVAEFWAGLWGKLLEGATNELKQKLLQEAIEAMKDK